MAIVLSELMCSRRDARFCSSTVLSGVGLALLEGFVSHLVTVASPPRSPSRHDSKSRMHASLGLALDG